MNKKIIIAIAIILIVASVFVSGCVQSDNKEPTIKSKEEVSKTVSNISQDVKDVSSALDDIDKTLG